MSKSLQLIEVDNLQPNAWNPNVMPQKEYLALKEDMEKSGPSGIDPLIVSSRKVFFGEKDEHTKAMLEHSQDLLKGALGVKFAEYIIVDGEHRWKIAKELNWKTIACDVREITESEAKQMCYRRNRERGTLDPFKEATLFKTEVDAGLNQQAIADKYLIDRGTVSHRLSLLKLTPETTEVMRTTGLSVSHAETLTSLSATAQKEVAQWVKDEVKRKELPTVRDIAYQAESAAEDEKEAHDLAEALKTAKFPKCPTCRKPPVKIYRGKGLPWVECGKGWDHAWNLNTGKRAYEPTPRTTEKKDDKPQVPRTLRSIHTIKEMSDAVFARIKEMIPDVTLTDIRLSGKLSNGKEIHVDVNSYTNSMSISTHIGKGSDYFGFRAEKHDYGSGEKSSVVMNDWKPEQKDVDRTIKFIEDLLAKKPLPEAIQGHKEQLP